MSPPSASKIISPPLSIVRSPASEIVDPFIVISSTVRVVKFAVPSTLATSVPVVIVRSPVLDPVNDPMEEQP